MSSDNKIENKVEQLKGKAKEHIGKATNDEDLTAEGRADQAKSHMKQAAEKVKDALKD